MKRRIEISADILRDMYCRQGKTLDVIAADLDVSHGTIRRRAKEAGIEFRPTGPRSGRKLNEMSEADIAILRHGSVRVAASALGVSHVTVWKRRRDLAMRDWRCARGSAGPAQ